MTTITENQFHQWACSAEQTRTELEKIQRLLRVCVDSLQLASILELSHTTEVLDALAETTWEQIKPIRQLEASLFAVFVQLSSESNATRQHKEREQWRVNLPEGAIEAFQHVNAVFGIATPEGKSA